MGDTVAVAPKKKQKKGKPRVFVQRDPTMLAVAPTLTLGEVERLTGWSHKRVYELIANELLKTYKCGRRRYATRRAVDECIATLEVGGAS